MLGIKRQNAGSNEDIPSEKRPRSASTEQQLSTPEKKLLCDRFCWRCHKEGTLLECRVCPRSFHPRCDPQGPTQDSQWTCFECRRIMAAEDVDTRSPAMALLSVEQLRTLLKYAVLRLKQNALIVFHNPVPIEEYPKYPDYIVHPMDLSHLEKNIRDLVYGSTEAFLADVKWILHNSIIFNGDGHKLTSAAKSIVHAAKQEMKEIEICPDCYLHAHTLKEKWFIEPCRRSHVLVWAKMKGYPYWPGKALRVVGGNIDVRFFGAHDRAQVPPQLCFMLSYDMPQPLKSKKKAKFNVALEELEQHIQKLRAKLGGFEYATARTPLDTEKLYLQPISKVTTGRRHSDADQSAQTKGRTVTIVTSSWMRKMQAEGLTKSPIKEKKEKLMNNTYNSENSHSTGRYSSQPAGRMQGPQKSSPPTNKPVTIKMEPKYRSSGDRSNLPAGVFEISDRSLNIPKELDINCASVNLHVSELPYMEKHREFQSTLDKIQKRIRETLQDDSHDEESSCETTDVVAEAAESNSTSNQGSNKLDTEPKTNEPNEDANRDCDKTDPTPALVESNFPDELSPSNSSPPPLEPSAANYKEWLKDKKSCAFSQRLGQTIESCKAKLGIQEYEDDTSDEKSSDSEDEVSDEEQEHVTSESGVKGDHEITRQPDETELPETSLALSDSLPEKEPPKLSEEMPTVSMDVDSESEGSDKTNQTSDAVLCENAVVTTNNSEITLEDSVAVVVDAAHEEKPEESQVASSGDELVIDVSEQDAEEQIEDPPQIDFLANGINQVDSSHSRSASPKDSPEPAASPTMEITTPDPVEVNVVSQLESNPDSEMANYAHKLIDFMKELGKDGGNNPQATIRSLELELETQRWHHQQELVEIKHNTDLVLLEVRASLEIEKERALCEMKRKSFMEKQKALEDLKSKFCDERIKYDRLREIEIAEIKKKQWCANCQKEAIYYCCWNTSYCDYPCQQAHWTTHQETCNQLQGNSLLEMPHNKRNPSVNKSAVSSSQLPRATANIVHPTPIVAPPKVNSASLHPISPLPTPQQQLQQPVQVQYMPSPACYQFMAPNVTLSPSTLPRMPQARNIVTIQAVSRNTTKVTPTSTISTKTYGKP